MEKINKFNSLKWRLILYIPVPFVCAILGVYAIGYGSNDLQDIYRKYFYSGVLLGAKPQEILEAIGYKIVSDAQVILMPLWVIFCIFIGSYIFYKKEMEHNLEILRKYADKIAQNELEFEVGHAKENELGLVCDAFEKMRKSLLSTSKENIRITDDARRLNAAFSHDIRTPITVMKGYIDLLEKYIPEEKINKDKQLEILKSMHNQADRLENYALSMSSVQKLEDIVPNCKPENTIRLFEEMKRVCRLIDNRVRFETSISGKEPSEIRIDKELLFEVIENLLSNASRYANKIIEVNMICDEDLLSISVEDDGKGFSEKILTKFGRPYLREDHEADKNHFGLGIYISKLLCQKCGGDLSIENKKGAFVKASFSICEK